MCVDLCADWNGGGVGVWWNERKHFNEKLKGKENELNWKELSLRKGGFYVEVGHWDGFRFETKGGGE